MKELREILSESASTTTSIKVGDKIRTRLGGQTPGIVTKIEGDKVYFDHVTATYQTDFSGAKGKPKQYVAHITNVVKESDYRTKDIREEKFNKTHIELLKTAYSDLERVDPTSKAYKRLIDLLNSLPQDKLKQLADANIKFVSVLAKNRIKKSVNETKTEDRCWPGYKPTPGVKAYEKGSCMKEQEDIEEEAEHDGKKVTLNKPFRTPGQDKKFAVYVRNDKGNVIKLGFGDPNMEIKRDDPERRKNYRARHNCADPGPKWKANYWSCKMWADKPVSKIVEAAPPDAEIEKWIIANKERFKKEYGAEKGLEVLYAKAWDMYNKK
ncbi:hypothetical protein UFOVP410_62 [uncultured Caudovirales phage]|uniref:Uncharacterized protein n=1 Tax=uncultured Caudovirales phage TaxID=2100421 RepID=A0A6J5M752_9CAUD|nr:hypothetical protein UFOVP410_62 [uncultured Caudovirales phage]